MHGQMMDNNSYNIIMALASNLEALEVYHKYAQDGNAELWQQAAHHTEQVIMLLKQQLPAVMASHQQYLANSNDPNIGQPRDFATSSEESYSNTGGKDYAIEDADYDANKSGYAGVDDQPGVPGSTNQREMDEPSRDPSTIDQTGADKDAVRQRDAVGGMTTTEQDRLRATTHTYAMDMPDNPDSSVRHDEMRPGWGSDQN